MRVFATIAGVLLATSVSAAQQLIFHTVSFPDATSVQLSVIGNSIAHEGDYDFEVAIRLVETSASGTVLYDDNGKHRALVRCGDPAYVGVGGRKYLIDTNFRGSTPSDWKHDLWKVFCATPVS